MEVGKHGTSALQALSECAFQAEVRLHEPSSALDGGSGSGMDCLEHICSQAARYLKPGGFLAMETGGMSPLPIACVISFAHRPKSSFEP